MQFCLIPCQIRFKCVNTRVVAVCFIVLHSHTNPVLIVGHLFHASDYELKLKIHTQSNKSWPRITFDRPLNLGRLAYHPLHS